MDNDDMRRGRASAHKKFNEWKALLAGDGLLNFSYYLFALCSSDKLVRSAAHLLGPKGLIKGQFLDLSLSGDILEIHYLKTGKLFQFTFLSTFLLGGQSGYNYTLSALRMGRSLGLCFQLIDDLLELADENPNQHEKEINPFYRSGQETWDILKTQISQLKSQLEKMKLSQTKELIFGYIDRSLAKVKENQSLIENQIGISLNLD
jgi:geranylgeranyl pyrophosphate synthase